MAKKKDPSKIPVADAPAPPEHGPASTTAPDGPAANSDTAPAAGDATVSTE